MEVVIRADATTAIGTGHVMRCLALAQGLKQLGARIHLICHEMPQGLSVAASAIVEYIHVLEIPGPDTSGPGYQWEDDADSVLLLIATIGHVDLMIVDHYNLDARWERRLRAYVKCILVIDDLADRSHDADILLDPNYPDDASVRYLGKLPLHCQILSGCHYVLLREEFKPQQHNIAEISRERLLIQFGGSDPQDVTSYTILSIKQFLATGVPCDVIVGSAYQHLSSLRKLLSDSDFQSVTLHVAVSNISNLMQYAKMAVAGGGTSVWERCCIGLPSLVIVNAENQYLPLLRLAETHAIKFLGRMQEVSEDMLLKQVESAWIDKPLLSEMKKAGKALVDGYGVSRVVQALMLVTPIN